MTDPKTLPPLRVAMIGYSFMGAAHSQAWRTAPRFFDLPLDVVMDTVVGRNAEGVTAAASKLGWARAETDWRRVIERDDIDLIDICAPGRAHAEIAIAALDAGKHVLCEKPLARTVGEAEAMADAARRARARGVRAMVGFTYRRVPAVALMRRLVEQGRIGEVRHVRGVYLQDWLTDPDAPLAPGGSSAMRPVVRLARGPWRPRHRHGPVRHRRAAGRGQRNDQDLRYGAAVSRQHGRSLGGGRPELPRARHR